MDLALQVMKKHFAVILFLLLTMPACRRGSVCGGNGKTLTYEVITPAFHHIVVGEKTEAVIKEDTVDKVRVDTSPEMKDRVKIEVRNDTLYVGLHTSCLLRSDRAPLGVKVFVRQVRSIRNASAYTVATEDTLHFDRLTLLSENYRSRYANTGNFSMLLRGDSLSVIANGWSVFRLEGKCKRLFAGFYGEAPRLEAASLQAREIDVFQRSANDMLLYPVDRVSGDIFSTGDVILYHRPPSVNIREHYRGRVRYR